ncbi:MAG: polysaccharide biosynthesis/export family protein [Desulfosoma sp.]
MGRKRGDGIIMGIVVALWMSVAWCGALWAAEKPRQASGVKAEAAGTYRIGKGDVLEIHVWKEPVLSRETFVRMDGMISLPLLDDLQAAGRTPMEVKKDIQQRLSEFIEQPEVTVILKAATSQKFYMIGEIAKPGEYQLTTDITVLQAFAMAGGFTEWAEKDKVMILRREGDQEKRIPVNYKEIVKGKNTEQNILIQAGDTIVVP